MSPPIVSFNNVSFSLVRGLALPTVQWNPLSYRPPDRAAASYSSFYPFTSYRGGMWPSGAHVVLLNNSFLLLHGGCTERA